MAKNKGGIQRMKKLKTIDTVRERERESNRLIKLGFICNAKKVVKNKNIDKIKKIEYCVKTKREICTIHNALSFCI